MCELVKIKNSIGEAINVASIKQHIIQKIIDYASCCDNIEYIYLFGSSLEERCTEQSDIDLALISNITRSKLFKNRGYNTFIKLVYNIDEEQEYDILQFNSIDKLRNSKDYVCSEILENGALIYAKKGL